MTMTSYQSVETALATLKRERDKLNTAIAALEGLVTTNGSSGTALRRTGDTTAYAPVSTEYANMTMKEASISYLRSLGTQEPQSTRAIADGIRAGGIRTQSASLYRTLYNVLNVDSERANSAITKIGSNWALREWGNR
jgi:hypothetical protein